jgi:acylphosphatase
MSDNRIAYHIFVFGRVQGVGFRAWTLSCARRLRVTGWVRNAEDGSVEIHAEAEPSIIASFLEALSHGPPYGRVDRLDSTQVKSRGYRSFIIEG